MLRGTIGGSAAIGAGAVLTGTEGLSAGTKISLGADATDFATTVGGAGDLDQGNVTVTNNALVFQIGANQHQTVSIAIDSVEASGLGIGVSNNQFTSLDEINVTSASKSQDALGVIDAAIDEISNIRGTLGAFQANTLESTASNMRTTLENTVNAESVIRDTDFAEEISNFTNSQVLVQAGTSVLSNANPIFSADSFASWLERLGIRQVVVKLSSNFNAMAGEERPSSAIFSLLFIPITYLVFPVHTSDIQ